MGQGQDIEGQQVRTLQNDEVLVNKAQLQLHIHKGAIQFWQNEHPSDASVTPMAESIESLTTCQGHVS